LYSISSGRCPCPTSQTYAKFSGGTERVLREMAAQCDGGRAPKCPVIDALFDDQVRPA
jgi:hypothetical protein